MDNKDIKWYETQAQKHLDSAKSVEDYKGVVDDCDRGLELDGDNVALLLIRARAYVALNGNDQALYNRALRDCNRVMELGRKDATVYSIRAQVYLGLFKGLGRRWEEAVDDCDSGLRACGHSTAECSMCAELFSIRARALLFSGDLIKRLEAFSNCNEGLRLDNRNAWLYATRAQAYLGSNGSALKDICSAIELDDTVPTFFLLRAIIYKTQGKLEKARTDCEKAVELSEKLGHTRSAQAIRLMCKYDILGESTTD